MSANLCPRCNTQNSPGAKFCRSCGNPMPVAQVHPETQSQQQIFCNQCGSPNQAAAKHCVRCGSRLGGRWEKLANRFPVLFHHPVLKRPLFWGGLAAALLVMVACLVLIPPLFSGIGVSDETPAPIAESGNNGDQTQIDDAAETIPPSVSVDTESGPQVTRTPIYIPGLDIEIELPQLTTEEEIEIGREAAAEVEREYPISSDSDLIERVKRIGNSLIPHQPRNDISYVFKIIDTPDINAFALPGGFIYIFRGMLDYVTSDDELAGVIGHEIAHVALRHGAQQIEAITAGQVALETVILGDPDLETIYQDQSVQIATAVVATIALNGWGRQAELDADEYGTIYMAHAGHEPQAVINLFERFAAEGGGEIGDPLEKLLATHPPFADRIERVEYAIVRHEL